MRRAKISGIQTVPLPVTVVLMEKDGQSVIVLKEIVNRCTGGGDKQEMLRYFERVFIDKLKVEPVARSADVLDISSPPDDPQQSPPQSSGSQLPVKFPGSNHQE